MKNMRAVMLCTCVLAALPCSIALAGNLFPIVTGTKTASGNLVPSGNVTYTVVLSNTGTGAQADNPGNEFTDVLPAGLTLISATATAGTALATVASNTATWNGSIAAGGSVTITILASINAGTGGMTISNQGTISYDADGNGSNESNTVTDDPGSQTANDPTSFMVGGVPVRLQSFDVD
jgi:uncharacterized repeat protein (TIGR01451 family)